MFWGAPYLVFKSLRRKSHPRVSTECREILNLWFDDVQVHVGIFDLSEWCSCFTSSMDLARVCFYC